MDQLKFNLKKIFDILRNIALASSVFLNMTAIFLLLTSDRYAFVFTFFPDNKISNDIAAVILALISFFVILANFKYKENKKAIFVANLFSVSLILVIFNFIWDNITGEIIKHRFFIIRINYNLEEKKEWLSNIMNNFRGYYPYEKYPFVNSDNISNFDLNAVNSKKQLLDVLTFKLDLLNQEISLNQYTFTSFIKTSLVFLQNHPIVTSALLCGIFYVVSSKINLLGKATDQLVQTNQDLLPVINQLNEHRLEMMREIVVLRTALEEEMAENIHWRVTLTALGNAIEELRNKK